MKITGLKNSATATLLLLALCAAIPAVAQSAPATISKPDQWKSLAFLEGTWDAKGQGNGAAINGTSTFQLELDGHIMARHSRTSDCKGPDSFDCEHGDLLYVFADAPGAPLKAIFFDNEGHVIHYDVSTPSPGTAIFLSDAAMPGPQFQLVYSLQGNVMAGKFQMRVPGQPWKSYLEWSGAKK